MRHQNHVLRAMPADDRAALEPFMTRETLAVNEVLIAEGAAPRRVYFPLTAIISTVVEGRGRATGGPLVGREAAIGLLDAMEEQGRRARMVGLAGDCVSIPADVFRRRVLGSRELALVVLREAAEQLERTEEFARCSAIHDAQSKTSRVVLELGERVGRKAFAMTQAQLASFVGVTRSSVSRCVAALRRKGLVDFLEGEMIIHNRHGLLEQACDCYRELSSAAKPTLSLTTKAITAQT